MYVLSGSTNSWSTVNFDIPTLFLVFNLKCHTAGFKSTLLMILEKDNKLVPSTYTFPLINLLPRVVLQLGNCARFRSLLPLALSVLLKEHQGLGQGLCTVNRPIALDSVQIVRQLAEVQNGHFRLVNERNSHLWLSETILCVTLVPSQVVLIHVPDVQSGHVVVVFLMRVHVDAVFIVVVQRATGAGPSDAGGRGGLNCAVQVDVRSFNRVDFRLGCSYDGGDW